MGEAPKEGRRRRCKCRETMAYESPREVPAQDMLAQEMSNTVLVQDVPAQAETIAIDTSLGADGTHANVAEPRPGRTL
jgi:hypothetical protein